MTFQNYLRNCPHSGNNHTFFPFQSKCFQTTFQNIYESNPTKRARHLVDEARQNFSQIVGQNIANNILQKNICDKGGVPIHHIWLIRLGITIAGSPFNSKEQMPQLTGLTTRYDGRIDKPTRVYAILRTIRCAFGTKTFLGYVSQDK